MIKRLVWFTTGLATGAGAVVVLGKRLRRRVAEFAPVRVAERSARRLRSATSTARDAFREGVVAMRHREQELKSRLDDRMSRDPESSKNLAIRKGGQPVSDSKVIVLRDAARSSSTRGR